MRNSACSPRRLPLAALVGCSILASVAAAGSALAGPNVGGVLILHYNPEVNATCDSNGPFCGQSGLATCDAAITRYNTSEHVDHCPTLFVLAAFPTNGHPRVKGATFGLDYPSGSVEISEWASCADFELSQNGWPAPGTGTALTFLQTQQSILVELYQLSAWNVDGNPASLRLIPHPLQGGYFGDDSIPALLDEVTGYGEMGFDQDGLLPCPGLLPASGACCFPDGHCEFRLASRCTGPGETFQGDGTSCTPNPCTPVSGACCMEDGSCQEVQYNYCLSHGGIWHGYSSHCVDVTCAPGGACCFTDGSCVIYTSSACTAHSGTYQGDGTVCNPNPCPQPGACCFPDGHCSIRQESYCQTNHGVFLGPQVPCNPNPCLDLPGACCLAHGGCQLLLATECVSTGGIFYGYGVACESVTCPPVGACCLADGSCIDLFQSACQSQHGIYEGDGVLCASNPCPPSGACCFPDGSCLPIPGWSCTQQQGSYAGDGSACDPNPCPQPCGLEPIIHRENAPAPLPRGARWPTGDTSTSGNDGPNHNGVLLLHTNASLVYTSDQNTYCGELGISSCDEVVARQDGIDPAVIFVLAAFPLHSHPRLAGITFGVTYGNCVVLDSWGACADFEIATSAWPAPGEGTALTFNVARTTLLSDVYWFGAYAYDNRIDAMTLIPHPTQGAFFADDSTPSVLDPIAFLGSFGFNRQGATQCPTPAPLTGGCCLLTGECIVTTHANCTAQQGTYYGDDILCEAQPCVPRGACCVFALCYLYTVDECAAHNGTYHGDGTPCTPTFCGDLSCGNGVVSGTQNGEADAVGLNHGNLILPQDGTGCGTLNLNSDGSYENAYAWTGNGVLAPFYGSFADCFSGSNSAICSVVLDLTQTGNQAGQRMDVYVWGDGGGCPGNVLCLKNNVAPGAIAFWPSVSRHVIDLSGCCADGNFWVGYWGNWPGQQAGWYVGADLNGFGGCPVTNVAPGVGYPSGWHNVEIIWGPTQALGIGCETTFCGGVATQKMSWGKVKALYDTKERTTR